MHKPAPVDHPVQELIRQRWSPRAFSNRPVEPQALRSLLEAARWAPSSYNEQPWCFIVATRDEPETFARLLGCLAPGNQTWAKDAQVLMLSVARTAFERNGKPNRHAFHDVGLASAQLALQAIELGVAIHFMAGFDAGKARKSFRIPEGFEPVAAAALGYHTDAPAEEALEGKPTPRRRKPLSAFVFGEAWGDRAPLVP